MGVESWGATLARQARRAPKPGVGVDLPVFFARLLEKLPAGAYACDAEGLITYFNPCAVELWGRAPRLHDAVDRFCGSFKLFATDGAPIAHAECWMALALRERKAFEGREIVVERPSGERLDVLAYANPILDDDGRLLGAVNVLVDISKRKHAERALERSERNLNDFFENGAIALHWAAPDGTILRANAAELAMLGYRRDEYVGHNVAEFHVDAEVIEDILARLTTGEKLHDVEARLRCKDGSIKHVLISSNGLWEDGRFVHTRCFTRDITEQKRAENALIEADRRKNEFLAMLAHELRNPLAPIRNAVELLRLEGSSDADVHQARDVIDRQVSQLSRLVDDLLDVARITRGKLELRRERVELAEVVRSAVETARPLIDARGHTLSLALPPEPVPLHADLVRLAQVFLNLLSNAARYTDAGGHLELAAQVETVGRPEVVVRVRDDGHGIPATQLPHVFDVFTQGAAGARNGRDGLGIGLTLVKSLVELHGGRVTARSDGPGKGSEFTVRLPLATRGGAMAAPAPRATPDAAARRVLIVDDNADATRSLQMLLSRAGHEVETAFDSRGALQQAAGFRPEVVLLDIGLPDADGYETCRRLREEPWGRDALLVAVTGWGQEDDKRRAREAGFDRHLTKPVEPAALRELLAQRRTGG